MKEFGGKILFLDRNDINTDEIIPAKYLTEIGRNALESHLLEDLNLEGFDPASSIQGKKAIVTRENFGCGSSREHAPWALEANGIHIVIASSFARIFRQNMFNCGMLALTLSADDIKRIFNVFDQAEARIDWDLQRLVIAHGEKKEEFPFTLSSFEKELVEAGGWVNYANGKY